MRLELALSEHHFRHFTLKNLELSYTSAAYWFISPQCVLCHFLSIQNNNSPDSAAKSRTTNQAATNKPSPSRARKKTKNGPNEDKVKREAKSRIAAIRKQGKLRQQQSVDSDNFIIINGTPNEPDLTLNNNLPLETSENGSLNSSVADDASLNSSLNSSLEGLCDSLSPESHQQSSTPSLLTREG